MANSLKALNALFNDIGVPYAHGLQALGNVVNILNGVIVDIATIQASQNYSVYASAAEKTYLTNLSTNISNFIASLPVTP